MKSINAGIVITLLSLPLVAADWAVIGAGNATCAHWRQNDRVQQAEIISWMAGFASSENLGRASSGKPEFRLEYLTPDFLKNEINNACSVAGSSSKGMLSVLLSVLGKLPVSTTP